MKLMTKEIEKLLPPIGSQEEKDPAKLLCVVHYFHIPRGWDWWVIEGLKLPSGDWRLLAKVTSPECPGGEVGYVTLAELEAFPEAMGLKVERDRYWEPTPLPECP